MPQERPTTLSPTSANGFSQSIATLDPNNPLLAGATYVVVVTRGVKDVYGDSLDANKSWTFKVGS